jgi:hypothetical protein
MARGSRNAVTTPIGSSAEPGRQATGGSEGCPVEIEGNDQSITSRSAAARCGDDDPDEPDQPADGDQRPRSPAARQDHDPRPRRLQAPGLLVPRASTSRDAGEDEHHTGNHGIREGSRPPPHGHQPAEDQEWASRRVS